MENTISALLTVFGIMLIGFFAERARVFPETMQKCLNLFVYWVSFPSLIFTQTSSIQAGAETFTFIAAFLSAAVLCSLASMTLLRVSGDGTASAAARTLEYTQPNAAFLGIPFIAMVLPDEASAIFHATLASILYTPVVLMCDACMGVSAGSRSMHGGMRGAVSQCIRNPNLLSCALGCIFPLLAVHAPAPVMRITSMLGSTAAPCALFSIGMLLASGISQSGGFAGTSPLRISSACAAKLLLHPAATCAVLLLFGCSGTMLAAGTLSAAMPTAVIVYVICERHGVRASESSLVIIASTILSVLSLPAVLYVLRHLGAC
ncbi:MAG: AEC family transporter [Mailhella sp.]|nr:AEC family transporter [Mailhella sp.]